jgi:hypothetical protein
MTRQNTNRLTSLSHIRTLQIVVFCLAVILTACKRNEDSVEVGVDRTSAPWQELDNPVNGPPLHLKTVPHRTFANRGKLTERDGHFRFIAQQAKNPNFEIYYGYYGPLARFTIGAHLGGRRWFNYDVKGLCRSGNNGETVNVDLYGINLKASREQGENIQPHLGGAIRPNATFKTFGMLPLIGCWGQMDTIEKIIFSVEAESVSCDLEIKNLNFAYRP